MRKVHDKRSFDKLLRANGFRVDHHTGSHSIYKDGKGRTVAVNNHLNRMVAQRLIKENNLVEE